MHVGMAVVTTHNLIAALAADDPVSIPKGTHGVVVRFDGLGSAEVFFPRINTKQRSVRLTPELFECITGSRTKGWPTGWNHAEEPVTGMRDFAPWTVELRRLPDGVEGFIEACHEGDGVGPEVRAFIGDRAFCFPSGHLGAEIFSRQKPGNLEDLLKFLAELEEDADVLIRMETEEGVAFKVDAQQLKTATQQPRMITAEELQKHEQQTGKIWNENNALQPGNIVVALCDIIEGADAAKTCYVAKGDFGVVESVLPSLRPRIQFDSEARATGVTTPFPVTIKSPDQVLVLDKLPADFCHTLRRQAAGRFARRLGLT